MLAKVLLFLSAYSPLPLLIGIRDHNNSQMAALLVLAGVFALALPLVAIVRRLTSHPRLTRIDAVASADEEVSGYLASYILPFATLSAPTGRDLVAFIVFGFLLAVAYLQAGRLALNPWLFFFRIRIWTIDNGGHEDLLLARRSPAQGDEVNMVRLVRGLYFAKEA